MTAAKTGPNSSTVCHKSSEECLRLALEATDLAVWDFDPVTGIFQSVGRPKALWGLKPNESLDYSAWLERLHLDDRTHAAGALQRALDPAGTGQLDMRYRVVQTDGSVRWMAVRGQTHFAQADGQRRAVRLVGTLLDTTWMHSTALPRISSSSDLLGYVGSTVDITDRHRAEEDSRRNEARLESLLRISQHHAPSIQELLDFALHEAIVLTESKIGYIFQYDENKKQFTLNTWSREVMKQCTIADPQTVYQLEKTGIWGEAVRQARPIIVNDFHVAHPLKKGYPEGHAPLHKYMTVPILVDDHVVGVVGVANKETDYDNSDVRQLTLLMDSVWKIADRKRAEQALQAANQQVDESLARLQAVVESMTDSLIIADAAGNLLYHNPASMALHEYGSQEEAYSRAEDLTSIWEIRELNGRLLPPEEWPLGRSLRGERYSNMELRLRRCDTGREFIGSYNGTPVYDRNGRMILAIVTIRDITEIKRGEEQLKALNETLERRVAERTAVAEDRARQLQMMASQMTRAEERERRRVAHILHEHFQQLLVGAKFDISLMRSQLCGRPDCKGPPILERINAVLDQSISESRSLTVELSPPILYAAGLADALQWLGSWMHEKHGLTVSVQADKAAEPPLEDLRILLFQGVRELLFNVVKHAGVKQAHVRMDWSGQELIRVSVTDQGAGFDPRTLGKNGRAGGFGIFSLRERLEFAGGQLRIDSRPGEGTTIVLLVPRHMTRSDMDQPESGGNTHPYERAEDTAGGVSAGVAGAHKIRILLADDHLVVRDGLARLLERQPDFLVVGQAADGQQAVDLALQLRPDVVLMDVTMPRLSGVEATQCIVSQMPQVRVVGLSMHTDEGVAASMSQAGAVDYIRKTAPPESLLAAIRMAVNGRK